MKLERLSANNLDSAIYLLEEIFPDDPQAIIHFTKNIDPHRVTFHNEIDEEKTRYYVAYTEGRPIGVTGHYQYFQHPDDAWLGWYGISGAARGKGFGKRLLELTADQCRKLGFTTLRSWTENDDEYKAVRNLYRSLGFQEETFSEKYNDRLVYSKSLTSKPLKAWSLLTDRPQIPGGAPEDIH